MTLAREFQPGTEWDPFALLEPFAFLKTISEPLTMRWMPFVQLPDFQVVKNLNGLLDENSGCTTISGMMREGISS